MGLPSNLFIKVFIAFWLVTVAILGSWLITTDYFESQLPRPQSERDHPPGPPHRIMLRMIYNLENQDGSTLARTVDTVSKKHDLEVYLITQEGKDLLGREPPVRAMQLARRLQFDRRRPFINSPRGQMAAYRIKRPDEGNMAAVFVFPKQRAVIIDTLSDSLWLRIGLAILISGLVCFGLSRLITNRIRDLQVASRQLADGDLDTRLKVRDRGGDETDELARDFNTMAGQLQERIQAQKRLLGDVSHELRSPLTRLRLSLALAQEKPEQRQGYMDRIERETERLEELIEQLLSSQSKEVILDTPVDLAALLTEVCDDTSFEGQGMGKRCRFETDQQQAPIMSHSDLLRKGFENILRNALHHTEEQSTVEVRLTLIDENYEVSITDRGPGVPEADLEKIFDEFFRSDTARTREAGGFGLGLAIARRAILQHGGRIEAQNTGSGLRVVVRLPAHFPHPIAPQPTGAGVLG